MYSLESAALLESVRHLICFLFPLSLKSHPFDIGKSTLAKSLGEALGLPVHYEEVMENDYLTDFYGDMRRYAFPLQIYLLNRRFRQHQQIIWQGKGGVQDRTIYEDSVFAKVCDCDRYPVASHPILNRCSWRVA
jgi:hypothetical protein